MPCFTLGKPCKGQLCSAPCRSPGELEEVGDGQAVAGLRQGPGVVQQAGQVDGRDGGGHVVGRDGGGSVRQPHPQRDRVVHPEQAVLPGVELDPVVVILRPAETGPVMQPVSVLIDCKGCCRMEYSADDGVEYATPPQPIRCVPTKHCQIMQAAFCTPISSRDWQFRTLQSRVQPLRPVTERET